MINILNDLVYEIAERVEMVYFGEAKEKWTSAVYLIKYLMNHGVDDGGEEENWVRFQEEHLGKENYCLSIWVVSEFVK